MKGFIGKDTVIENVLGDESSKIFNNCRIYDTVLDKKATIGDFSTVRESKIGERSTIQRYGDIWGVDIGKYTCIGRMSTIQETQIGSFCALADYLTIGCDDHDYKMVTTHPFWHDTSWGISEDEEFSKEYRRKEYEQPCVIGNDVWMGAGVIVCRNVTIGNGCVIGAGAIITKDIEPYSVVVGVPGRVIKKRFDDKTIERLENAKWWDLPVEVIKENIHIFRDKHLNEDVLEQLEIICEKYRGR